MGFLLGSDRARYGKLIEDLENDFLQGHNNYPTTITAGYNLLTNWKQENRYGWRPPSSDAVAFANVNGPKTPRRYATRHTSRVINAPNQGTTQMNAQTFMAERANAGANEGAL
jgi:hypothetical protein